MASHHLEGSVVGAGVEVHRDGLSCEVPGELDGSVGTDDEGLDREGTPEPYDLAFARANTSPVDLAALSGLKNAHLPGGVSFLAL